MSDKLDLILSALQGVQGEIQKLNQRIDTMEKNINRRFDAVDNQFTDMRRLIDRDNIASTAGDEKLLDMITDIHKNMATKEDVTERIEAIETDVQILLNESLSYKRAITRLQNRN